ncbi:GumC family protein [Winogradskyella aurantia]|uniref:non-specific protein-tyrosine kinase n=1 Tax=Winogradskyella aurantia TaxID=1915063 RepID=A0A265UTA3_9FLAO|nr:tyrosine-protein kinase family protein [Winogradskyella aurantia]OZV68543.1 tyrosine protein kinase [Winogradskyella aurantia]
MDKNQISNSVDLRQNVELYISHWKIILLSVIICVSLAYTHLRYATSMYKANATIKIKDDGQANKLPTSMLEGGSQAIFGTSKGIEDEMKIMQSRSLLETVVKNLKLNIGIFERGSIKELERYENPPVSLSFFESDSIINSVNYVVYIKVKSTTDFLLFKDDGASLIDRDESEGILHGFGEKIETNFGGLVLTPNVGKYAPRVGSNIKIKIEPIRKVVGKYSKMIELSSDKESNIINLGIKETNPKKAIDILDEVIKSYNEDILSDKEDVVRITSDFINNRLQKVSEELEQVDYTAEQLQKKNRLTALNSQADINIQNEKATQSQIATTSNKIQLIEFLEEEISAEDRPSDMLPSDIGIGDPNTAQVTQRYNELVRERDRLLKNSSEKNPVVANLNDQIDALKQNLKSSLQNMKETSQLTLENLTKERNRISGQLYAAPTKARQFRDIKRQQDIKESLYLYLLQRREESAIKLGMYTPNAKIIDSAYSSYMPVAPNKMITYLAAILFGLAIPIGFIIITDLLDTRLYNKNDLLSILSIPYLGDIPKTSKKEKLIKKVDYSSKAEAFRILRSNIDFMLKDVKTKSKKLFVTSTKAQEGKSHTSVNLASSISYSNKRVLIIEMDIRIPKILNYLNIKSTNKVGLTDYIIDKSIIPEDIVVNHPDNSCLDIIPSGTIPPNPAELLMSDRVGELFQYFENKYDYIVADTSAVGLVSDTLLISKYADMFIYVVSADNVDKRQLKHVIEPLYEDNRLPRLSLLLNGVSSGKKGYGYGYGYGYGNSPGKKKKWYQRN